MAKIVASVSKKIPVPGIPFSNQQFGGSLEVEVPDGVTDEQLQTRLQELYALLGQTVEGEIAAAVETARSNPSDGDPVNEENGRQEASRFRRPEEDRGGSFRNDRNERQGWSGPRRYSSGVSRDGRGYGSGSRDDYRPGYRREGGSRSGGNDGGRGGVATQAQVKAVFGIAKANGIERRDLMERVEEQFGVRRIEELNVRQASALIEQLKAA